MSLKLVPPLGYYEEGRLINGGANRWAARLKLGSILPLLAGGSHSGTRMSVQILFRF